MNNSTLYYKISRLSQTKNPLTVWLNTAQTFSVEKVEDNVEKSLFSDKKEYKQQHMEEHVMNNEIFRRIKKNNP